MSTHTLQTEVEIEMDDGDNAYPTIEITFDYSRGSPAFTPRGEYGPIDPPEPPQIEFREAKLIDVYDHRLKPDAARVQKWGEAFLESDAGYQYASDCAELDLLGQRAAHLENSREQ